MMIFIANLQQICKNQKISNKMINFHLLFISSCGFMSAIPKFCLLTSLSSHSFVLAGFLLRIVFSVVLVLLVVDFLLVSVWILLRTLFLISIFITILPSSLSLSNLPIF